MPKILIIEDEVAIASMYQFKLEQSGFEVRCAYDGAQGLALAEEIKPDLILLDLRMPVMTGEDMLEKLRATDWGASIRVIILTNISKDEAPSKLRFLNVDRYVVKAHHTPLQIAQIVTEIIPLSR